MYSYGLLEPGCYYLVQETAESGISLIKVTNESDQCMYVFYYGDQLSTARQREAPMNKVARALRDFIKRCIQSFSPLKIIF